MPDADQPPRPDAFQDAVDRARLELGVREGKEVSVRELLRRAGYTDNQRPTAARHLRPSHAWSRGHHVPPDLVARLAAVLPTTTAAELEAAAVAAAGHTLHLTESEDPVGMVARYLGDPEVSEEEKAATRARILELIARQQR